MTVARVRVVDGPDEGLEVELPLGGRLVVGRDPEAHLWLHDPSVSRRHCALEHRLGGVWVEDLGSRQGTVVDGQPLDGGLLATGSLDLRVGSSRLEVVRDDSTDPPPKVPGVELKGPLGVGGSGTVFLGVMARTGEPVAVKVLANDADPVSRQRFEREVMLRERLEHPAIARILEMLEVGGRPCLIRELVPGLTLEERILEAGSLAWSEVVAVGSVVAGALQHAHERGVVHRDVKPSNVVLGDRGLHPKLIDFDLAKRLESTAGQASLTRLTGTGEGLGTLSYLAPEQLTAARDVGPTADVYGLGLTLYHALSGRRPFAEVEPEEFITAKRSAGPAPLAGLVPGVPRSAVEVLERAYRIDPAQRYPSCAAFADALGNVA